MSSFAMRVRVFLEKDIRVKLIRVWEIAEGVYLVYMEFDKDLDLLSFGGDIGEDGKEYTVVLVGGPEDDSLAEIGFEGEYYPYLLCWKNICGGVLIGYQQHKKITNSKPTISIER